MVAAKRKATDLEPRLLDYRNLVLHCSSNFGLETLAVLAFATVAPRKPWLTPKRLIRKPSCDGIRVLDYGNGSSEDCPYTPFKFHPLPSPS